MRLITQEIVKMHGLETIIVRNNGQAALVDPDRLANAVKADEQEAVADKAIDLMNALNATMPRAGDYAKREYYREARAGIIASVAMVNAIAKSAQERAQELREAANAA